MSTPPMPPDRPENRDDLEDPTGIRALLAGLPDPGPMPADLVARINASLATEQLDRKRDHTVVPLVPLASRHGRWRRAALVAAAVAVVAVGVPALLTGSGPGDIAALLTNESRSDSAGSAQGTASSESSARSSYAAPSVTAPTGGRAATSGKAATTSPVIYASGTAYTTGSLSSQLGSFAAHPGTPVRPLAAESPALGPIATPAGLQPCLHAIGVTPQDQVIADVATYNGDPVVVIVVSGAGARRGYVLSRECTMSSAPLAGPVPLG